MVEVTLTPPRSRRRSTKKSKICWIPFKKQILDNRSRSLPTTKTYAFASTFAISPQHNEDAPENENQEIIHNNWDLDNDYLLSRKLSRTNSNKSRSRINRRSDSSSRG